MKFGSYIPTPSNFGIIHVGRRTLFGLLPALCRAAGLDKFRRRDRGAGNELMQARELARPFLVASLAVQTLGLSDSRFP